MKPNSNEIDPYFHALFEELPETDPSEALAATRQEFATVAQSIPETRGDHRYADDKWSIKEVLLHVVDCERVFGYRALRFSRGDTIELSGFEENDWAPRSGAGSRSIASIANEFAAVRGATEAFFANVPGEALSLPGVANGKRMTVGGFAFLASAHARHHLRVIRERYA